MKELNVTLSFERGLRKSKRTRRNVPALIESRGFFPADGAIASEQAPEAVSLSGLSPAPEWPFPQVFRLKQLWLVATETAIYEYLNGTNIELLSGLTPGIRWSFADFQRYVVGTNGKQYVVRDGETLEWSVSSDFDPSVCVLNYNGQLLLGGYGVEIPSNFASLLAPSLDFSSEVDSQYLL